MIGRASDAGRVTEPQVVQLGPGELYCSSVSAVVTTILGSCVAVVLIDRNRRACGINHHVMPVAATGSASLRYGNVSIKRLIQGMADFGCQPADLHAKIFGGAAVLPFGDSAETIGDQNVRLAFDLLQAHHISIVARRTGGTSGLLLRLNTDCGRVMVRTIQSTPTERKRGAVFAQQQIENMRDISG